MYNRNYGGFDSLRKAPGAKQGPNPFGVAKASDQSEKLTHKNP